ncbi:hypothetical protein CN449_15290 [Bacillus thuringiensis]|uniref:hypothetical protein n=1 Tax=Bacillus thuringiensis TaxID=1428 RepID=UPI000BF25886|nr:hypothetical protein [Bacillus thuringiensis]PEW74027.1 hypothetical protein CN449_15290 [Bacillus thuringiensis]
MTECELIMVQTLRDLEFHPAHALAALNNVLYEEYGSTYAVQALANAIERMEEIEEEDGVL